jgi:hypothetical protein
MARRPDPQLHDVWRDRVRRQQTSALTIEQFCVQERVARSKFHAWKRRFRLMDSRDQCPALPVPSAFLPVTVRLDERTRDEPLPIEADLPNGVRLRIPTADALLACRLIHAVASANTHSGGSQ